MSHLTTMMCQLGHLAMTAEMESKKLHEEMQLKDADRLKNAALIIRGAMVQIANATLTGLDVDTRKAIGVLIEDSKR